MITVMDILSLSVGGGGPLQVYALSRPRVLHI